MTTFKRPKFHKIIIAKKTLTTPIKSLNKNALKNCFSLAPVIKTVETDCYSPLIYLVVYCLFLLSFSHQIFFHLCFVSISTSPALVINKNSTINTVSFTKQQISRATIRALQLCGIRCWFGTLNRWLRIQKIGHVSKFHVVIEIPVWQKNRCLLNA